MGLREGSYGQYCPIARAVDVLGERWTMLILRDLLVGSRRFNDLARGNPRLSRSLLSKRLRQLEQAGLVEKLDSMYMLTQAGEELRPIVFGIGEWGARWQFGEPHEDELEADLLLWWAHERLDFTYLPDRRIVLQFDFDDDPTTFWIVKDSAGPSLCKEDPGFEVDVAVRSELSVLYQVWLGRIGLQRAVRDGRVRLIGEPALVRRIPDVFLLSPVAPAVAAAGLKATAGTGGRRDDLAARRGEVAGPTTGSDTGTSSARSLGCAPVGNRWSRHGDTERHGRGR